jgi:hypothetical protein
MLKKGDLVKPSTIYFTEYYFMQADAMELAEVLSVHDCGDIIEVVPVLPVRRNHEPSLLLLAKCFEHV